MDFDHTEIVPELLRSYRDVGGLNRADSTNLPSRRDVAKICEELLALMFPGFFDCQAVAEEELEMLTAERLAGLGRELHKQIGKSLRCKGDTNNDCFRHVGGIVSRFLRALPALRELLRTDVQAAYDGDPAAMSIEEIILAYPSLEAVSIQRMAHVLYNEAVPIMPRMMTEWAHSRTGIDIHPGARIGTHFFIDHGTGVVIGETCAIGSHVKLYQGVNLAARSFPKDAEGRVVKGSKRHPNLEDNVTIYANAVILGGETTIGANSTIGANAFITKSVPPNSLVALGELEHRIMEKERKVGHHLRDRLPPQPMDPPKGFDSAMTDEARELVLNLGLEKLAEGVLVCWNRRLTATAGLANYRRSLILLNPRLREISEAEVKGTFLHELAHLVAFARADGRKIRPHGPEWRQACSDLGIPGEQRCHELPLPRRRQTPKHAYRCPGCQGLLLRVRPLKKRAACYRCCRDHNGGRYSRHFMYVGIPLEEGKAGPG